MNRLLLHIGTHKTGSSAIQHWIADQSVRLREEGIHYGATDRPPHPELPKHNSLYRALVHPKGDFDREVEAILKDFKGSGCHTLILSEEGLSEPYYHRLGRIAELRRHFQIEVVCFLRRQDYLLESLWNQRCREGLERRSIDEFVRRPHNGRLANYSEKLVFWSRIGTVRAVAYDEASASSVAAFADVAEIEYPDAPPIVNPSPSMNCAAFCNLLNRLRIGFDPKAVIERFQHDDRRHALGRRLRMEVLEKFAPANAMLADRFGIVFDTSLPDEPPSTLRWPELHTVLQAALPRWRLGHTT